MPTDDDILRARLRTVGVQEHKISLELGPERGQDWYIYDVGGSRSQRSAWESFFEDGETQVCAKRRQLTVEL
jgi:guanine nucleotide-binding protein subunit alpha